MVGLRKYFVEVTAPISIPRHCVGELALQASGEHERDAARGRQRCDNKTEHRVNVAQRNRGRHQTLRCANEEHRHNKQGPPTRV